MLTRIEIDGFKTFRNFTLDLQPFTAIVGPNASGKSNLFDALRFLSLLSHLDIRTAMQDLRGEPEELFRKTQSGVSNTIKLAVEVVLSAKGTDAFGTLYELKSQRLRYEIAIASQYDSNGNVKGIFVRHENCTVIAKKNERSAVLKKSGKISYSGQLNPFIRTRFDSKNQPEAIEIRQDGTTKRGRPITLPAQEASRTALSTVSTAEFPHLYALRNLLNNFRFLEINPTAARRPNDRFEDRNLKSDASNLSAVLAKLKDETTEQKRPEGILSEISYDLATLIPSVRGITVKSDSGSKEYSFDLKLSDKLNFSSRVISDGTLRLLALLTVLNDPLRSGVLCFEEPENGVHEGRIEKLVSFLREAATKIEELHQTDIFQILVNTHSPAVMAALKDHEIVAADMVSEIEDGIRTTRTRMRNDVRLTKDMFDPESHLTRFEIDSLLKRTADAA